MQCLRFFIWHFWKIMCCLCIFLDHLQSLFHWNGGPLCLSSSLLCLPFLHHLHHNFIYQTYHWLITIVYLFKIVLCWPVKRWLYQLWSACLGPLTTTLLPVLYSAGSATYVMVLAAAFAASLSACVIACVIVCVPAIFALAFSSLQNICLQIVFCVSCWDLPFTSDTM